MGSIKKWGALSDPPLEIILFESRGNVAREKIHPGFLCSPINERFFYEYDFNSDWQHQIRVEAILSPKPNRNYPVCISGRLTCPPEDCGGPWAFMALRQRYSLGPIMMRLAEIAEEDDIEDYYEEIQELRYLAAANRFDRKAVNRQLQDYASGNEAWMWE